jgi:hypothetical protein
MSAQGALMKRRDLIMGSAGLALELDALQRIARCDDHSKSNITADSDKLVSGEVLDLAPGFRSRVIQTSGDIMTDDFSVPVLPHSMACFTALCPIAHQPKVVLRRDGHSDGSKSSALKVWKATV